MIIGRKGMISTAGLLFRANPGFQLAFVLLVLFWAYVMQVKHQPFMSSVERKTVILEHQAKVAEGDSLHVNLATRISQARLADDKKLEKRRRKQLGSKKSFTSMMESVNKKEKRGQKLNYFWNYNTVERTLLSCLIIVCVCGVMFESDRFQDNHERPSGNGFGAWVRFQQELVTWLCILVIFGSMFFYFAVMYSEIFGALPVWIKKVLCLKKQVDINRDRDVNRRHGSTADMVFTQNEFMLEQQRQMAADEATSGLRDQLAEQQDQLAEQQEAVKREKMRAAAAIAKAETSGKRRGGRGKKTKNKKKGFGATKSKFKASGKEADTLNELELTELMVNPAAGISGQKIKTENKRRMSSRELMQTAAAEKCDPSSHINPGRGSSFFEHNNDDGTVYYEDAETGAVTWTKPKNAVILSSSEDHEKEAKIVHGTRTSSFVEHSSADGNSYYEDTETGKTTWVKPENAEIIKMN
jgi:hypothetical protein